MGHFSDPFTAHRNVGIPVVGERWENQTYESEDMAGVVFVNCEFDKVTFKDTNFIRSAFVKTTFNDCVMEGCQFEGTIFTECSGTGIAMTGDGDMKTTVISQSRFDSFTVAIPSRGLTFSEGHVKRLSFERNGCSPHSLTFSDLGYDEWLAENTEFEYGSLIGIDISKATLTGASMKNTCLIRIQASGNDLSTWKIIMCNLFQANLAGAKLRHSETSIFAECDLQEADFVDADIRQSLFPECNASRANFQGATLEQCGFPKGVLVGADFTRANAPQSIWIEADLTDATLDGMNAYRSTFRNANLAGASVQDTRLVEADLHGVEQSLDGADTTSARGSVEWRAELERELRDEESQEQESDG